MALGFSRFRTRSGDRDKATDISRFTSVETTLGAVVADINKELEGLERRISLAYSQAAVAMDNFGEYGAREPGDEETIQKFEQSALTANLRLISLRIQSQLYNQLWDQLKANRPKL